MATVRLFQDVVAMHLNGTAPIKLILSNGKQVSKISTGILVSPNSWDQESCKVINHPHARPYNILLANAYQRLRELMFLAQDRYGDNFSVKDVRKRYDGKEAQEKKDTRPSIRDMFVERMNEVGTASGTIKTYKGCLKKYDEYCLRNGAPTWEEVDRQWLDSFNAFLAETAPSPNARSINLRCLRRIFSIAKKEKHITDNYPFEGYHIKQVRTRKRNVSAELLHKVFNAPVKSWQQRHLDCAKMMFMMRGICIKDFCTLRQIDYFDGRIMYRRSKTGKDLSIKVEPELKELIDKYRSKTGPNLFSFMDKRSDYESFGRDINETLKSIKEGDHPLCPDMSTYWLRHSWATIGIYLDISKETIAEGLSHEIGCDTTSIYIDFDVRKVDAANRKIIDAVFYGK